jgi:hypothetical protein
MISSKQKSMMSLPWEIITNVLLVLLLYQRFTAMWRVMNRVMDPTTITKKLVNSRKANTMVRTWRTEPKVGGKGKAKAKAMHSHAINVVVQTILPENAAPLNIWLNYAKNP